MNTVPVYLRSTVFPSGYLYSQGLNETIVGISMGLAGITGIMGAYLFTKFRKWFGLEKTGIFSYNFQVNHVCEEKKLVYIRRAIFSFL